MELLCTISRKVDSMVKVNASKQDLSTFKEKPELLAMIISGAISGGYIEDYGDKVTLEKEWEIMDGLGKIGLTMDTPVMDDDVLEIECVDKNGKVVLKGRWGKISWKKEVKG